MKGGELMSSNILDYSLYVSGNFKEHYAKKQVKKNEIIIDQKNPFNIPENNLYIVISGQVLVEVSNSFGKNCYYDLVSNNQLFGTESILETHPYPRGISYQARAMTDVVYLEINSQFFLDHMYINPKLYHYILEDVTKRYFSVTQSYQLMNETPVVRVSNALLNLARVLDLKADSSKRKKLPLYINQTFITKYIHSSKSRVSEAFSYLEEVGTIERKPITIINEEKLNQVLLEKLHA